MSGDRRADDRIDISGAPVRGGNTASAIVGPMHTSIGYVLAVLLTLATLALRVWLGREPGDAPLFILFLIPIVVSAYIGGLGPGLVSTTLAALGADLLLLEPRYSLAIASSTATLGLILLIVVGVLVSVLNEALIRARQDEWTAPAGSTRALERKVRAGFAIALAVLGIVSVLSFHSISHLLQSAAATQRAELTVDTLWSLFESLRDVETDVGRYVITGETGYLATRNGVVTVIEGNLRRLRELTAGDVAQQSRLDALSRLIAERMQIAEQVIALRHGGFAAARAAIASGEGKRASDALRGVIREMEQAESTATRERYALAESYARLTKGGVVLGGVLAFAFVAIALFLIGRDFAGRRRADATVHRQTQLLDLARDSILICDLENRVHYWNHGAQRLYGWAPDEAVGRKACELLATRFPIPREEINQRLLETGHWTGELTHTTRDSRTITVESHWSLRRDENGQPEAVLEINDDITQRKKAEAELRAAYDDMEARVRDRAAELARSNELLRENEQQFAGIVNSAMDGIVTVDEQQRIVLFNAAAERIFDLTAAEMLDQPLARLLPERYRAAHSAQVVAFGRTGLTRRAMSGYATIPGLRANGEEFPLEISISQVEVAGRKLYTSVLRDITERVAAGRVQSQLAAIVASSDDAIIGKTLDGTITSWNDGAQRLFGYATDEVVGKSITIIIPEDRLQEESMIIGKIAQGETVRHYETVRRCRNGALNDISVTVSPIRDAGGSIVGASKIARDISVRKQADRELRDREQELRTVTDAIPALIAYIDKDRRYRFVNLAYQQWFSLPRAEIIGKRMIEILGEASYREIASHLDRVLAGQPVSFERIRSRGDGSASDKPHAFHVNYVPSLNSDGTVNGVFIVAHDITEIKRAEENLLRTQKMEALGTLAGGIAHDFNNILPAILGFANLAEADLPRDHPARGSLAEIRKAGKRAGDLVRRILTFSRPQEQAIEAIDLESVIKEALKLMRTTLPATIEVRTDLVGEVPPVNADATQIYQIVVNLLTNASDAIGPRRGVIEVGLDIIEAGTEISSLGAGSYARLTVSDDGSGMDRETQRRIFDPFFTTKSPGKGTGLGLSIVNNIVVSLGGAVNVYSEPGKGTKFHVYFPLAAGGVHSRQALRGETARGRGERVMYIDDEEALVFLVTYALKRLGYEVSGYTEARSALQEFRMRPQDFDAVITDVSMPGASGYDVARELSAIRPGVPIIMVSGYVRPEDEELARLSGARELILKPNNVEELAAAIERLLRENPRV